VNLYLGNEAADADSTFSALCYGYHCWLQANLNSPRMSAQDQVFLPLTFVRAEDLSLRAELQIILNKVHLNTKDLLLTEQFLSSSKNITSCKLEEATKVRITLLDHNSLSSQFASVLEKVVGNERMEVIEIIDHHHDEQMHLHVQGGKRNIAFENEPDMKALVGSCCSLIHETVSASDSKLQLNREMAWPLLGVILLDTINMDPVANKGTSRDQQALRGLQEVLGMDSMQVKTFFDELSNAKLDPKLWDSLTVTEALRFDYKKFPAVNQSSQRTISIGFSSVLLPLESFCAKENLQMSILEFMEKCQVESLIVMSFYQEIETNKPMRELMVVEKSSNSTATVTATATLSAYLETCVDLQLTRLSSSTTLPDFTDIGCVMNVFNQGNVKASRKQVAPIVVEYFERV
jgi:exopolyphosphatase